MPTSPDRWRPSPFVRFSLVLHLAAVAAIAIMPGLWQWWLAVLVADHLVLTCAGLWPRSTLIGDNMLRLPAAAIARNEIAITIDDGPDPLVTPQVLDLLDRYQASASFFVIGERAARYPDLAREIVKRGHAVENHSQRHSAFFSFYGPGAFRREIKNAQLSIQEATGDEPLFFRAPAGLRNPFLYPALVRLGLRQVTWTRRGFDTMAPDTQRILQRLTRNLAPGDILLLHDGHSARTDSGQPVVLEVLPSLLEQALSSGLKAVSLRHAMRS
jgi:peptidoglycan/xylan/chitin deacetylase (PgdA/CDA1 family)